jgi:hypothetical protein
MLDSILHIFGMCPDHLTHINFLDAPYQELLNFINYIKSVYKK